MNYHEIKQEIIDEILKNRKTTSISKKMGFNFDKVARWQNGSKQLRWDEFCELCKHTKTPLLETLNDIGFFVTDFKGTLSIVKHVKNYFHQYTVKEFSDLLDINFSTANRIIKEESYPDLEFILRLIDLKKDFLPVFINSLIRKKDENLASHLKYPWMPAVANSMVMKSFRELPAYSASWIASFLGITETEVELAVKEFVKLGLIVKDGPHYQRAPSAPTHKVITVGKTGIWEETNSLIKYWTKFIYKKMSATTYEQYVAQENLQDKCAWRVFACGPNNMQKINDIIMRAEKEIHELFEQNPEEPTDVRVMLLHHFSASTIKKTPEQNP